MALRIHRQSAEVGVVEAPQTDLNVRLFRFGIEVLGGEPSVITPIAVPSGWEMFLQNWTKQVQVSSLWSTDVQSAQSSVAEERRGLLTKPQRTVDIRWTSTSPGELDELVPALKRMTAEQIPVPLYSDQTVLTTSIGGGGSTTLFCDTTDRRLFVGGLIAIAVIDGQGHRTGVFFTRSIVEKFDDRIVVGTNVTNLDAGRALIFPLLNCEVVLAPQLGYRTNHVAQIDLSVQETYGPNTLGPLESGLPGGFGIFDGLPIWNFEPDWSSDVPVTFKREGRQYGQGRWQETELRGDRYRYAISYPLLFERFEALDFLRFAESRRGRVRPFWHVDQEDIWTIASQSNGDTEVNITALGDFTLFTDDFDYIGIVMNDGTVHVSQVTGIDDETATWEVTVTPALPSLDLTQVRRVARARRCRFDEDSIVENWDTTNICRMTVPIIEVLAEGEVTL